MREQIKDYVTIIAAIGTIAIVAYTFWPSGNELTYTFSEQKKWSVQPDTSVVQTKFYYEDSEVKNVYSSTLKLTNTGNNDLIGLGNAKSIITDKIDFKINNITNILNYDVSQNDPNATIYIDSNFVHVSFNKWLENEKLRIEFLTSSEVDSAPSFEINSRQLVDGDIIQKASRTRSDIIDKFVDNTPNLILYLISGVILFTLLVGSYRTFSKPIIAIRNYLRFLKWKEINADLFEEYLNGLEYISDSDRKFYLSNIHAVPHHIWKNFEGEPLQISESVEDNIVVLIAEVIIYIAFGFPFLYILFILVYSKILS